MQERQGDSIVDRLADGLSDHDVYFVFGCELAHPRRGVERQRGEHVSAEFDHFAELVQDNAKNIWDDGSWVVSHDFRPLARKLFVNGQATIRKLSALGLKLANTGARAEAESAATLVLHLRRGARSRATSAVDAVRICIDSLDVIRFASGLTIAVLKVKYALSEKLTLEEATQAMLDGNHYLGHPLTHRHDSLSWVSTTTTSAPRLMGIVRALMLVDGWEPDSAAFQRIFLFTAMSASEAGDADARDLLLSRLARKHTIDYPAGDGYSSAFGLVKNVRFAVMPEGAALMVSTADSSEFSTSYLKNSVPGVYLPAVVACVHEHLLLRQIEGMLAAIPTHEIEQSKSALEQAVRTMLRFRLLYRLQSISGISMHKEFHARLRTALSLDDSLDQLVTDTHLHEQQMAIDLHRRDEERRRWITAVGSAAAAFAAGHEFFEIGIRLRWDHDIAAALAQMFADKTLLHQYEFLVSQRHVDEVWGVAAPAAFAVLFGWLSWLKKWTFPRH
jgi:hypothetical protein